MQTSTARTAEHARFGNSSFKEQSMNEYAYQDPAILARDRSESQSAERERQERRRCLRENFPDILAEATKDLDEVESLRHQAREANNVATEAGSLLARATLKAKRSHGELQKSINDGGTAGHDVDLASHMKRVAQFLG
jgi:hypothetical protein